MSQEEYTPFLAEEYGVPLKHQKPSLSGLWRNGVFLISLAALVCSTIPLFVKQLHGHINAVQVVCASSIMSWLLTSMWLMGSGEELRCLWTERLHLLVLRGVLGGLVTTASWTSFQILSMDLAVSLFFVNPAIAVALELVVFRKRHGLTTILGCVCSVIGVFLISYPTCEFVRWAHNCLALFGGGMSQHLFGVMMALLAALSTAGGYVCVQAIGPKVPLVALMWWYHTMTVIGSSVYVAAFVPVVLPSWHQAGWMLAAASAHFTGQLLLNHGCTMSDASHGAALFAQQVLWSYVWHLTILRGSVQLCGSLGSAAILLGVYCVEASSGMSHRHAELERERSQLQVLRRSISGRRSFVERVSRTGSRELPAAWRAAAIERLRSTGSGDVPPEWSVQVTEGDSGRSAAGQQSIAAMASEPVPLHGALDAHSASV